MTHGRHSGLGAPGTESRQRAVTVYRKRGQNCSQTGWCHCLAAPGEEGVGLCVRLSCPARPLWPGASLGVALGGRQQALPSTTVHFCFVLCLSKPCVLGLSLCVTVGSCSPCQELCTQGEVCCASAKQVPADQTGPERNPMWWVNATSSFSSSGGALVRPQLASQIIALEVVVRERPLHLLPP